MASRYYSNHVMPLVAMFAAECAVIGSNIVFKRASLKGMSYYVFVFYSCLLNTLILLPFVFFHGRNLLPFFGFSLQSRVCLLGIMGGLAQIFGYKGVEYSSPTLASAISNLSPALTFILAVIFRMEMLALRKSSTQTKIVGTMVSISGALVVVLYKGPTVISTSSSTFSMFLQQTMRSSETYWMLGGLLVTVEYILYSILYLLQTQVMQMCPSVFAVTFFYNLWTTIVCAPICFVAERNLSAWRLMPDAELVALIYTTFFGTSFITTIHSWCLHLKGPVYVTAFKPLSIAIAAVMSLIILRESLYLGSVIGAVMISTGVYAVIWGKAKEEKMNEEYGFCISESSAGTVPLLQHRNVDDTELK